MRKILMLALYNETVASSRTRVFQFLPHLRSNGFELKVLVYNWILPFKVSMLRPRKWRFLNFAWAIMMKSSTLVNRLHQIWIEWRLTALAARYDRVFIQKVILPANVQARIKAANPHIVFDMDDAIYLNTSEYKGENFDSLYGILKLAVVENEGTKGFFEERGVPSLIITGPIDCGRYRPASIDRKDKNGKIIIGWIGSFPSTQYLADIRPAIERILQEVPECHFEFIGALNFIEHPRIRYHGWSLKTEQSLLERFDIGLMPLRDDEWCRGKGGYKLLQYMAMGIPGIVSPVGINKEILIAGETGFFSENQDDWFKAIRMLVKDRDMRIRMGQNARMRAENQYSYERYSSLLTNALEEA